MVRQHLEKITISTASRESGRKKYEGLFDTGEGSITVTHEGDRRKVIIDNAQLTK